MKPIANPPRSHRTIRGAPYVESVIDFGAAFGAPAAIGIIQGTARDAISRDQALQWLGEALESLGAYAREKGTTLQYAVLNRYETNLFNRFVCERVR